MKRFIFFNNSISPGVEIEITYVDNIIKKPGSVQPHKVKLRDDPKSHVAYADIDDKCNITGIVASKNATHSKETPFEGPYKCVLHRPNPTSTKINISFKIWVAGNYVDNSILSPDKSLIGIEIQDGTGLNDGTLTKIVKKSKTIVNVKTSTKPREKTKTKK